MNGASQFTRADMLLAGLVNATTSVEEIVP